MTLTWLATGLALLSWPIDIGRRRVETLRASGRLAVVASPRALWVWPAGTRDQLVVLRVRPLFVALAAGGAVALLLGPVIGALAAAEFAFCAAVVVLITLSLTMQAFTRRRAVDRLAAVTLAVALVAAELDAGAAPAAALSAAGPIGAELDRTLSRPPPIAAEMGDDPLARVVAAARMSRESGVALAEILTRVRADLTALAAARRDLSTAVAGPRASATLLALLPVIGIGLGAAMGAHPLTVLLHTAAGRLLLCLGLALDGLGLLWTERLIARALR